MPDAALMERALDLARAALGSTWPNPAVGCVIAAGDRVLGAAATAPGGRPHAEPQALALAGAAARGATAYVTLEPCAHTGQTGPCCEALIEAGVARVVVAMQDPDPRVAGRGLARLRQAGVEVAVGEGAAEAAAIVAGFVTRVHLGRPRVLLKLAQSLDGRIAMASGESRWITGPQARAHVHALRAQSDAILIGAGTARADDPMLDVRDAPAPPRPPVRIVADSRLSVPQGSRLVATAAAQPLWLLHGPDAPDARKAALTAAGATLVALPQGPDGQLDLRAGLSTLGDLGLTSVLCEGGAGLAASLISAQVVDELLTLISGKVIGGGGHPSVGPLPTLRLADVPLFEIAGTTALGPDIAVRWLPVAAAADGPQPA